MTLDYVVLARSYLAVLDISGRTDLAVRAMVAVARGMAPGSRDVHFGHDYNRLEQRIRRAIARIGQGRGGKGIGKASDRPAEDVMVAAIADAMLPPEDVLADAEIDRVIAGLIVTVGAECGVTAAQLRGPSAVRWLAKIRFRIWHEASTVHGIGPTAIGRRFGNRDHSTVISGIERHADSLGLGGAIASFRRENQIDIRRAA